MTGNMNAMTVNVTVYELPGESKLTIFAEQREYQQMRVERREGEGDGGWVLGERLP